MFYDLIKREMNQTFNILLIFLFLSICLPNPTFYLEKIDVKNEANNIEETDINELELPSTYNVFAFPTNPIVPDHSDASESFSTAVELNLNGQFEGFLHSFSDVDYYKFTSPYSNYFQFNIESSYSYYASSIAVYHESNLLKPIAEPYNNNLSGDLTTIPVFYAEQGETYYFKYTNLNFVDSEDYVYYYARLYDANVANISETKFEARGYVQEYDMYYNGTDTIYVYLDSSTYASPMTQHGYSYAYILRQAMVIWNKVGIKQFVETTDQNDADIIAYIYSEEDNANGKYVYYGDIDTGIIYQGGLYLNEYYQENYSYNTTLKTSLHEFGHALGLGHTYYSNDNVMRGGTFEYRGKLGQGDIACYRYLWG